MRRSDKRLLPAFAMMAVILGTSGLCLAQSPATPPPDATPKPESQPATTTTTLPKAPATAEQIGDALMAHQRYQAAIEAYKKAEPVNAAAWNKMGIAYQLMFNLND